MTNDDLSRLDDVFGLDARLRFERGAGGLIEAVISTDQGDATVSLHGGQVLACSAWTADRMSTSSNPDHARRRSAT